MNSGAAIDNYQSAYTNISNNNTTNVRKRKNASRFGGAANSTNNVPRYCVALSDITLANPAVGGRFRCRLNS